MRTVAQLIALDPATVRRGWSVVLERTVRELQGVSCVALEDMPADKKEIATTRSFGHVITEKFQLVEAVTDFATRAGEKVRGQSGLAGLVHVFIRTSPFRKNDAQYSRCITVPLRRPTCDTRHLVSAAVMGLDRIYRPGYNYSKAGVILMELQPDTRIQNELDLGDDLPDKGKLMVALDALNQRYGKGTVLMGSSGNRGNDREWSMKQERRTPLIRQNGRICPSPGHDHKEAAACVRTIAP